MDVAVSHSEGVTTARLTGEVDTYSVPGVRHAFEGLGVVPEGRVVVDLRDVSFLDSSGLGAIIALHHRVRAQGGRMQLVCGDVTLPLVRLTRIDQVIEVVTEPDDHAGLSPV